MNVEEFGQSLAYDVAFWSQGIDDPDCPVDELGRLTLEVSAKFRVLGVLTLLVKGEPDHFFHNLIRSGRARLAFLDRARKDGALDQHHFVAGRVDPVFDVVAAGAWELCREIGERGPKDWAQGREYLDDFCVARALHLWSGDDDPAAMATVATLCSRYRAWTEGAPCARLDVMMALNERDAAAFDAAFDDWLGERDREIEASKARGQLEDPGVLALRSVWIEGLALLRIAERRGLPTEREYRYCPSLARVPMAAPFPGE